MLIEHLLWIFTSLDAQPHISPLTNDSSLIKKQSLQGEPYAPITNNSNLTQTRKISSHDLNIHYDKGKEVREEIINKPGLHLKNMLYCT